MLQFELSLELFDPVYCKLHIELLGLNLFDLLSQRVQLPVLAIELPTCICINRHLDLTVLFDELLICKFTHPPIQLLVNVFDFLSKLLAHVFEMFKVVLPKIWQIVLLVEAVFEEVLLMLG